MLFYHKNSPVKILKGSFLLPTRNSRAEEIEKILTRFKKNKTFTCAFLLACFTGTDVIRYPFKVIREELKIENCMRGSFATKTLRSGVEIKDVAEILGHSRIETTENYYISSSKESRKL